jgi:hypothetical protein
VESLREKQSRFAGMVAKLILQAESMGYAVTLGEAWRSPFEAHRLASLGAGIKNSLHCDRLAIDLQLFRDGEWLHRNGDYAAVGECWASMGGAWGGRFGDGNHFSLAHEGRK